MKIDPVPTEIKLPAEGVSVNLYQDLEMSYRYVQTHSDISCAGSVIPPHSHTFFELLLCRNSCGVEYLLGAERFRIQAGDMIVIPAGVSHCPLMGSLTEPYRRDVLWISVPFLESTVQYFSKAQCSEPRLFRTAGTRWEYLCDMFHNGVAEASVRDDGWELALIGNTLELLTNLIRASYDHPAVTVPRKKTELLDRVVAYIQNNLADKITLADTAQRFYVSESTISHAFQKELGVSFYRFVTQCRLIAAKQQILQGVPIETVSHQVGFSCYSAFYRAFRQEYGISPKQFSGLPKGQRSQCEASGLPNISQEFTGKSAER